ncbi:MAG: hypothetical protein AAGJ35_11625 [Myxococcota bacterium]
MQVVSTLHHRWTYTGPEVCGIPGGQTGALLFSEQALVCPPGVSTCQQFQGGIQGTTSITKATIIDGVTVGSSVEYSISNQFQSDTPVPGGTNVTVAIYNWDTVYFKYF